MHTMCGRPLYPDRYRFYIINGKAEFAFFTDSETDIDVILAKFFSYSGFRQIKVAFGEEWENLKFIKFDRELNEIHIENRPGEKLTKIEELQFWDDAKERKVKRSSPMGGSTKKIKQTETNLEKPKNKIKSLI